MVAYGRDGFDILIVLSEGHANEFWFGRANLESEDTRQSLSWFLSLAKKEFSVKTKVTEKQIY